MPIELAAWHLGLCLFAALNVLGWVYVARRLARRAAILPADVLATRRAVLWLAAVYVLGCAFRSVLPMLDEARMALYDTPLSRIAVGRSVATVAELCFVAQWVLLFTEAGTRAGLQLVNRIASLLLPLAVVAEAVSWLAVLTRMNLLHAIENSLWTFGGMLVLVALARLRMTVRERARRLLAAAAIAAAAYVAFMVIVDVPMYLHRWYASGGYGVPTSVGLGEILRRGTIVRNVAAWRADMPWLTLYFSAAVWLSLALVEMPPLRSLTHRPLTRSGGRAAARRVA